MAEKNPRLDPRVAKVISTLFNEMDSALRMVKGDLERELESGSKLLGTMASEKLFLAIENGLRYLGCNTKSFINGYHGLLDETFEHYQH